MKKFISVFFLGTCLLLVACSGKVGLTLPEVPKEITVPAERADYALIHFWDDLDFSDTKRSHNDKLMEQAFSDFITIFPNASEDARKEAVANLLKKAEVDKKAFTKIRRLAESYLYYPDSPYLNEEYYEIFLENFDGSPLLEQFDAVRGKAQLQEIKKNSPGSKAPDFEFTLRSGQETTLYGYPASGNILLVFYDPDCDHCEKVIKKLKGDKTLNREIADGKTTVIAVYSGKDKKLWDKTAPNMPENWVVGYEPGTLDMEDIYIIRRYPSIYLLTPDRTILKKNLQVD